MNSGFDVDARNARRLFLFGRSWFSARGSGCRGLPFIPLQLLELALLYFRNDILALSLTTGDFVVIGVNVALGCFGHGNPPDELWALCSAICVPVDGVQVRRVAGYRLEGCRSQAEDGSKGGHGSHEKNAFVIPISFADT